MHSPLDLDTSLRDVLPLWGVCEHEGRFVISAAFPYLLPEERCAGRNISRYAVPRDYHGVCGARLEKACALLSAAFPGEEFRWHCDSTSLPEVALAIKAGLGVRGKHNLLITKEYGTWVFLGEIITTPPRNREPAMSVRIPPVGGRLRSNQGGLCDSCRACVRACPTGALSETGFAKEKCLSFITQKNGSLSPEEAALLRQANTVWGCDLCQEACPRNRSAKVAPLPEFLLDPIAHVTENTPIANRAYAWRGEGIIRRNLQLQSPNGCASPPKKPCICFPLPL